LWGVADDRASLVSFVSSILFGLTESHHRHYRQLTFDTGGRRGNRLLIRRTILSASHVRPWQNT
jgi:hypothetical protein